MPRVAAPIKNGETLDKIIADKLTEMAERGIAGQRKITVGGHPPGLMLQITAKGASSWLLRTTVNGKRREIGLGAYRRAGASNREAPSVSLSQARARATEYHDKIGEGRDPVAERKQARAKQQTFKDVAEEYIAENEPGWSNPVHIRQWKSTMRDYVYPKIGEVPIATLSKVQVKSVLMQTVDGKTLLEAHHETAKRVRQRIATICDHAIAHDYRTTANPAAMDATALKPMLPRVSKEAKEVQHHPALPFTDVAAFMAELRKRKGTAALALQFLIYTAARSGEVRLATWSEIKLDEALWTVDADRMKKRKQHTVPLTEPALAILRAIPELRRKDDEYIFPTAQRDDETGRFKALSYNAFRALLLRMKRHDITAHGFRSTFSDWANEVSPHSPRTIEEALAHGLKDESAKAYARGNMLEKRKTLMRDWAQYVTGDSI